ncbi:MAG: methyltransferase domain-containing protein [Anaerolineae bacterium]|uniref:SAM-dependent methyltransferase n=1 Tax=Promineifilum sp. TaxID=2664178 RepID=UPI001DF0FA08|nr:methyltransferase domain-containing protein [Anaerolineales bacterium]MCB8934453.1 methyltransferase domain-containing protein [Promineifilum sp.]MCO5179977.1 methyltransferase domain-containing protein [Promineifilum sp.]MCW5847137.1 methyltransferase domain-containing protein [Anaerolineae bacterium]
MNTDPDNLNRALWRIYNRPDPALWQGGGNLPWNDPDFSARMLREHLDESHGAATRQAAERAAQLDWLWTRLALGPGHRLLDMTCGPGLYAVALAERGLRVTGVDFSPASVAYARRLAGERGVAERCEFIEGDVRDYQPEPEAYDATLFLYGQLAVFPRDEAATLLRKVASSLRPGGRLAVELLDPARVDKKDSSWWFTDDAGLWGERPFLHLGERRWDAAERASVERYTILHLETGLVDEIVLCDQAYEVEEMTAMMRAAGFSNVTSYPTWDGLPLYDAAEWVSYVAEK